LIIAEMCQNHLGDKKILKEMVNQAADAGANFAKIQTFFADDLTEEWKKKEWGRVKGLELSFEDHKEFCEWCKEKNIIPMTSVYTVRYAQKLYNAGFRHIKIGSAQASKKDLAKAYVALGFDVAVSTGGQKLSAIPRFHPLWCVMHCVSLYPTPANKLNLRRLFDVKSKYPLSKIGFSDHTQADTMMWGMASKYAIQLGAEVVERHFTILDRDKTKDGLVSINTEQLKKLCDFDRKSLDERLEESPIYGIYQAPQDKREAELIESYKDRWVE